MIKVLSTFGFFAGIGLLAIALVNPASLGSLQAREQNDQPAANCRIAQVAVDEGYGITAMEARQVCGR